MNRSIWCVGPVAVAFTMAIVPVRAVRADLPKSIDVTDIEGCAVEHPAVVEASAVLNDVARELSRGGELEAVIDGAGYAAATAESLYLKSPISDDDLREVVEVRYCAADHGRVQSEFGVYRIGNEVWIVLAAPRERPTIESAVAAERRVLELVNTARKQARRCGDRMLAAAPPLTLSTALRQAASRHAQDMAQHGSFDHEGSDGSLPRERVTEAGYRWRATGENIAAGQSTPDAVVAAWLDSPGHCANVMGAQYKQMGLGFALAPTQRPAIYWALELASPR